MEGTVEGITFRAEDTGYTIARLQVKGSHGQPVTVVGAMAAIQPGESVRLEGGWTTHQPSGEELTIYAAAMRYQQESVPLIVLAGKEYGTGSSRDWAAKGTLLLGIRAVIAESFERIHRSNLVGMGVLPLVFETGQGADSLGLSGTETFAIEGLGVGVNEVTVIASGDDGGENRFQCRVRVDTPKEWEYYENGGILHYVLRQLAA